MLTEGFASGDAKALEMLSNHDSAEEKKLIGGLNGEEVNGEDDDNVAAAKGGNGKGENRSDRRCQCH